MFFVRRSPFPVPRSPFCVQGSPFCVPRSLFPGLGFPWRVSGFGAWDEDRSLNDHLMSVLLSLTTDY